MHAHDKHMPLRMSDRNQAATRPTDSSLLVMSMERSQKCSPRITTRGASTMPSFDTSSSSTCVFENEVWTQYKW
jgi:hypothetical protein